MVQLENKKTMDKKIIYISGANSGYDLDERYNAFQKAADEIKTWGEIVNPMSIKLPEEATWVDYMKVDISLLLKCNTIYMLKGWRSSRGANLEFKIAQNLKYNIIYE